MVYISAVPPSPNFYKGVKMRNSPAITQPHSHVPLSFGNAVKYLKLICYGSTIVVCPHQILKFGPRPFELASVGICFHLRLFMHFLECQAGRGALFFTSRSSIVKTYTKAK